MSEPVVQGPAPEIAMNNIPSPKADKTPEASPDAPSTTFIQLDGRSPVPSQFRTSGTFTITRLQSPAGLPDRITKLSPASYPSGHRNLNHRAWRLHEEHQPFRPLRETGGSCSRRS